MGLGKTIQAITLMHTLLRQGPTGLPVAKRAAIVCPSSLVGNWCKEIEKWLGDDLKPTPVGENKKVSKKIAQVTNGDSQVLVISYDQLKIHAKTLAKENCFGLVICDEGHRLKNIKTKTSETVRLAFNTKRRVILSG